MDTISRENSPSILPFVGVGLGVLAVILSAVALVKLGTVKTLKTDVDDLRTQVQSMAGDVQRAGEKASAAARRVDDLATQAQRGFDAVTAEIGNLRTDVNKLATAKPAPKAPKDGAAVKDGAAAAPGPGGDYTIKAGDGLAKIAKAHGVTLAALEAANPGIDSKKLKVGQKINLPK